MKPFVKIYFESWPSGLGFPNWDWTTHGPNCVLVQRELDFQIVDVRYKLDAVGQASCQDFTASCRRPGRSLPPLDPG